MIGDSFTGNTPGSRVLDGIRVLDLSRFMAGATLSEPLANMGADVIKIESIQALDMARMGGARLSAVESANDETPPWETSPVYTEINSDKSSITLDLSRPRGAAIFRRLVAISDIVMENYTPRVMPQFGLAYEELRAINPQLIMISLSGFGSTGPWRDFVSFAWPTEEATGFPHLTGYQNDDVPRLWGPAGADMFAGLTGAVAVMAALEYRRKSNRGQYIDLSQVEALSTWLGEYVVDYSRSGHEPQRLGNRDDAMAPHGVYPTEGEDSWIAIAVEDDAQWRQLCQVIGRDDWSSRPSLRHLSGRIGAHDELDKGISEWSVRQTSKWSAARLLQNSGVAAAPVLGGSELIRDPQLIARGFVDWRDRKWIGRAAYAGNWAHFSATPAYCSRPAPTLGQDNERILKDLLGISDEEYNSLESDGIIGTAALVKDAP